MYNKFFLLLLIIMLFLFLVIIIGLFLSRTAGILFIVFLRFILISLGLSFLFSLFFLFRTWGKIKIYGAIPLFVTLNMAAFAIIMIPGIGKRYDNYLFFRNYRDYTRAVNYIKRSKLPKHRCMISLPEKYKFLSRHGKVSVIRMDREMNIVFYYATPEDTYVIRTIIYTSSGKFYKPFDDEKKYVMTEIGPNWYFADIKSAARNGPPLGIIVPFHLKNLFSGPKKH